METRTLLISRNPRRILIFSESAGQSTMPPCNSAKNHFRMDLAEPENAQLDGNFPITELGKEKISSKIYDFFMQFYDTFS
jgi:hypothetical protein